MLPLLPLLLLLLSICTTALADTAAVAAAAISWQSPTNVSLLRDNSANCTCYAITTRDGTVDDGSDADVQAYFAYHRFYDFRGLAGTAKQFSNTPDPVDEDQDEGAEDVEDPIVMNSDAWNSEWGIQNWGKNATEEFPVRMVNSPRNIYISQTSVSDAGTDGSTNSLPTYLTLRTVRLPDFQSAAEIEHEQKNLMHASVRMRARVVGAPGAVAGFFTFIDDDNESDVEILTDDPKGVIRYTNQPSVKDGDEVPESSARVNALPDWDDWQTHRIDWLPYRSAWYINGELTATNTYSIPRRPSYLVLNMWSDGGEWSGNMSVGGVAELQVQWVEMLFNTSGPVEGPGDQDDKRKMKRTNAHAKRGVPVLEKRKKKKKHCDVVCAIDDVDRVGYPEVRHVSSLAAAVAAPALGAWGLLGMAALVALMAGL
ncbi:glycoside hydrolase family 16 protein [Aplosporella prunicola CBS 121167]|uniref:Glycoside hydrolase family 16 protein n=1 Tax=Aplosporella prunicola CBS 121167 TaxID=1176127 RepID=A0A6A6BRR4_9PEZI|nr:glycoside hydrolase family 16 protein [Aplosporella prunicola CBS 121167]KAF2145507.1 glycoside hydrolase family 16 protein [Aplosporella prunicola CBS 121167]